MGMQHLIGQPRISSSDRLALENISSSSSSSSRNSGGTREARALVARAKHARWMARAKRVRCGRVRSTRWLARANNNNNNPAELR